MKVYNLEEFATKYNLKDIYGAYAAHFYVNGEEGDCFPTLTLTKTTVSAACLQSARCSPNCFLCSVAAVFCNCMKTMPSRACS